MEAVSHYLKLRDYSRLTHYKNKRSLLLFSDFIFTQCLRKIMEAMLLAGLLWVRRAVLQGIEIVI